MIRPLVAQKAQKSRLPSGRNVSNDSHLGYIMKFRVLTAAALVTIAALGTAGAADLGVAPIYKALPPPMPVYNWTGCCVGGGGGYAFWQQDSFLTAGGTAITSSQSSGGKGWFGQGQVG